MSSNRKIRRAREARRGGAAPPSPGGGRAALAAPAGASASETLAVVVTRARRKALDRTSGERFPMPAAAGLWGALLGWSAARLARMAVVDAVHDVAVPQRAAAELRAALVQLGRDEAHELSEARLEAVLGAWERHRLGGVGSAASSVAQGGGGQQPAGAEPLAPEGGGVWGLLAELCVTLGLEGSGPDELRDDWWVWSAPQPAHAPRQALLALLGQTEQVALELGKVTRSPRVGAIAQLSRVLWSALAYGDERHWEKLERWAAESL